MFDYRDVATNLLQGRIIWMVMFHHWVVVSPVIGTKEGPSPGCAHVGTATV